MDATKVFVIRNLFNFLISRHHQKQSDEMTWYRVQYSLEHVFPSKEIWSASVPLSICRMWLQCRRYFLCNKKILLAQTTTDDSLVTLNFLALAFSSPFHRFHHMEICHGLLQTKTSWLQYQNHACGMSNLRNFCSSCTDHYIHPKNIQ